MSALKCYWLGHPIVELDGNEIKMETRKATAMLVYLSMSADSVQREKLSTMFWSEWSQQKALANLRRTLSSLRERLPTGVLDSDREKITLQGMNKKWLDVNAFEQYISQVMEHGHLTGESCDECLNHLREAITLYRGPFLEGYNLRDAPEFDEWQSFQRQTYQGRYAWVLEMLSVMEAARGERDQAVVYARQWVMLDPLCEKANCWLMELYERGGQRSAALQQYRELAKVLKEQVGEEPETRTKTLYESIRGDGSSGTEDVYPQRLPLLKTKLYIPALPERFVKRPRLVRLLEETKDKAMTIVSAPAGFGKTTLLAEWITQTELPVAWLSLDSSDNDTYRFLAYLLAALQSLHDDVGMEAKQILSSPQMIPPHIFLASLINDLGKINLPYMLVLDDYQFINEHKIHETISYLIEHMPPNMHIMIATRADPPLQIGRLRANDELLELRSRDLRFTPEEAKEFLNEVMSLDLTVDDISFLGKRTEGWVVGLKMAALSLKGSANPGAFIRAFSGSTRYVLDYLVEEVIKQQQPHIQAFLLATSILEKFNSQLCDHLIGEDGEIAVEKSQAILEYLERHNLFLNRLDDEGSWFRYHHLFGDLLRLKFRQNQPEKEKSLHHKAARWFAEHEFQIEAIEHALAAMDFSLAAELIEKVAITLIMRSEIATLSRWIECLPVEVVASRPRLLISQAWVRARMGDISDLETTLKNTEAALAMASPNPEWNDMRDYVVQLQAYIANLKGDSELAIRVGLQTGDRTVGNLPPPSDIQYLIGFQMGYAYYSKGELDTAESIFRSVGESAELIGDFYNAIIARVELAGICALHGNLNRAMDIYEYTQDWIDSKMEDPSLLDGILKTCRANILLEWNRLDEAEQLVGEGIDHARRGMRTNTLVHGYTILSQILRAKGDLPHAREAAEQAIGHLLGHHIYPRTHQSVRLCLLEQLLIERDLTAAHKYMAMELAPQNTLPIIIEELENIARARVLLALGEYQEASILLATLAKAAEAGGRMGRLIKMDILQALALQALGQVGDAMRFMEASLVRGYPDGYLRVFLDEGAKVKELLLLGKQKDTWRESGATSYIDQLIETFGDQ